MQWSVENARRRRESFFLFAIMVAAIVGLLVVPRSSDLPADAERTAVPSDAERAVAPEGTAIYHPAEPPSESERIAARDADSAPSLASNASRTVGRTSLTPDADAIRQVVEMDRSGQIPPIAAEPAAAEPAAAAPAAVEKKAPTLQLNAPILPPRSKLTPPAAPAEKAAQGSATAPSPPLAAAPAAVSATVPAVPPKTTAAEAIPSLPGILHVDESTFASRVLGAKGPVLVDFYAVWCQPCKALVPTLEEIAAETPHARVVKVDIEGSPSLAARYGVRAVPKLVVFKDGEVQAVQVGMASKTRLREMLGVK